MHEATIAMAIVEQAVQAAAEHGSVRISEIEIEIGELKQVVPEAMELAFTCCAEGTPAEGALLRMIEVKARAVCSECRTGFNPDTRGLNFSCPRCGQAGIRFVTGNEIILKSVTCEESGER